MVTVATDRDRSRRRPPGLDELDALVAAELDLVLTRRSQPSAEPEVSEALFLEQASAFLAAHPDPNRLIETLQQRLPAADPPPPEQPAPEEQSS